jgi:hypothetical protein
VLLLLGSVLERLAWANGVLANQLGVLLLLGSVLERLAWANGVLANQLGVLLLLGSVLERLAWASEHIRASKINGTEGNGGKST